MDNNRPAAAFEIDSRYAWTRLAVSLVLATLGGVGMWAVVVVLPAVQAEFGVDRAGASLAYTATMLGFAMGNAVVGGFMDRAGFMRPALAAAAIMGAGFLLASTTTSILQFAAVQGLMIGAGSSATFGPIIADISHWFDKRRGLAVAIAASGNYVAGAVWPIGMQAFLDTESWRTVYLGIGVICLLFMIPLIFALRRGAPRYGSAGPSPARPLKQAGFSPTVLQGLLIVAGLACCVAMSMPQVHIVAYCMDLGFGLARGAEMLALMLAGGIVSRVLSGFLADRIGGVPTLLMGSVFQGLSLLLYIPFDGLASLYIVSLVFGLSQGGIVPCYAVIVREYMPAAEAGRRVGVVIMATTLGMALGGWLSGLVYDLTGSYSAAFLNGIAWNLLNVSVMTLILLRSRSGPRLQPA